MAAFMKQACQQKTLRLRELTTNGNMLRSVSSYSLSRLYKHNSPLINGNICNLSHDYLPKKTVTHRCITYSSAASAGTVGNDASDNRQRGNVDVGLDGDGNNSYKINSNVKKVSPRLQRVKQRMRMRREMFSTNGSKQNTCDNAVKQQPKPSPQIEKLFSKFPFLKKQPLHDQETVLDTSFGTLRFDMDNKPWSSEKLDSEQLVSVNNYVSTECDSQFEDDFFGIKEYHGNVSSPYEIDSKLVDKESENIPGKYLPSENLHQTQFGSNDDLEKSFNSINESSKFQNIIEEQYFSNLKLQDVDYPIEKSEMDNRSSKHSNIFDEQYFDSVVSHSDKKVISTFSTPTTDKEGNIFDEQYFGYQENKDRPPNHESLINKINETSYPRDQEFNTKDYESASLTSVEEYKRNFGNDMNYFEEQFLSQSSIESVPENVQGDIIDKTSPTTSTYIVESKPDETGKDEVTNENVDYYYGSTRQRQRRKQAEKLIANVDDPQSVYDAVMKLRLADKVKGTQGDNTSTENSRYAGKVDSKGFRLLSGQTPDFHNMTMDVAANILYNSIICNHEDVLAIDKPYGIPSHGGPGVHLSIAKLLPLLAKRLAGGGPEDTLRLVHRLDKETTGVFLIARNQMAANRLSVMFSRGELIKKYWALTKGLPKPQQGIIDIPMAESKVASQYRMTLVPERTEKTRQLIKKSNLGTIRAVTQYEVLAEANSVGLLEITPETGVKHQIRCHLAFAMNTPILGDHKYSHLTKIAPQRLYADTLQRLGIRQSKVRHLPMHLHSKSIVLPEFNKGRNMFIMARLPKHFIQNMRRLQIKPPKKS